jgi:hypothetical protein
MDKILQIGGVDPKGLAVHSAQWVKKLDLGAIPFDCPV